MDIEELKYKMYQRLRHEKVLQSLFDDAVCMTCGNDDCPKKECLNYTWRLERAHVKPEDVTEAIKKILPTKFCRYNKGEYCRNEIGKYCYQICPFLGMHECEVSNFKGEVDMDLTEELRTDLFYL